MSISDILVKANSFQRAGMHAEAEQLYIEYLRQHPPHPKILMALGYACYVQGKIPESIDRLEQARQLTPTDPDIWFMLGTLFSRSGDSEKALAYFQHTLVLRPLHTLARLNMGVIHFRASRYQSAIDSFTAVIESEPDNFKALYNLGLTLIRVGRADEANTLLRRACALEPENPAIHTCMLFNLNYLAGLSAQDIFSEHRIWAVRHARPHGKNHVSTSRTSKRNIIRVGYLSPDFRNHSVFYFIHPVLRAHDRSSVEIYAYSDVPQPDEYTRRLTEAADHWRDISKMDDDAVLNRIHEDRIDILVDLAGHTASNRMLLLSRRAAPVQVSWLGYPGTTGLDTMDFRLTDACADPPATSQVFYTERLIYLNPVFLCYEPPADAPAPAAMPAASNGYITFGSFNNLAKINEEVISAWSEILRATPRSVLLLKAPGLGDTAGRNTILGGFRRHGIDDDRVVCIGRIESVKEHLATYHNVDIALDTFPYNGTTTTCEALLMGVPVITFAGTRHASRVGMSILNSVGLSSCIATSRDTYTNKAVQLANNLDELVYLRSKSRRRMFESPLTDENHFCRELEQRYSEMLSTI